METETTLVWTEGGVVLDTETTVDLDLALVVLPDNTEVDDALWDGGDLQGLLVLWVLLEEGGVLEGGGKLCRGDGMSVMAIRGRAMGRVVARWRGNLPL